MRDEQYYGHAPARACAAIAHFLPPREVVSRPIPERLSVVHVLAPGEFGGLESVVRLMAAGQRRRAHGVIVAPILPRAKPRPAWLARLADSAVPVEPIVAPPRAYLSQWRSITRLLGNRRPRIVHTHGYHADVLAGHAARRAGFPTVATVHGFVDGDWKNRLYEGLQRRALRRFAAVIAVSRPMAADLRASGVSDRLLHVVPNAFEADAELLPRAEARRELGLADNAFHIGWIGRLSAEKGPDVMLRALALMQDDTIRLSVLGAGPELGLLEALARELGISHRVDWCGVRVEAGRLATAFDTIVLSSRAEGTPIVLLEAMHAGVPIVATRVGGIPDVVGEPEALLVAPADPAAIAAAVQTIRSDGATAATRAAAARRRLAQDFSTGRWLEQIDHIYEAVLRIQRDGAVR